MSEWQKYLSSLSTFGNQYKKKVGPSTAPRVRTGPKTEEEKKSWKSRRSKTRSAIASKKKRLEDLGNVFIKVGPAAKMSRKKK